jgi:Ricin-type beta-trefoil lectin domain
MNLGKFVCGAIAMAGVAFTAGKASASETFQLMGKCMDLRNGNTANGTPVQLWDCQTGNQNQQWDGPLSDGTIRPALDANKCLDLTGWNTSNGTSLQIWDCTGGANQRWFWTSPYTSLQGEYGSKCVDDPGSNNSDGIVLDYWDCNGTDAQQFFRGTQFCTQQDWFECQNWRNDSSPPSWYRVYQQETYDPDPGYCGNSCTYGCPPGNYGSCPF